MNKKKQMMKLKKMERKHIIQKMITFRRKVMNKKDKKHISKNYRKNMKIHIFMLLKKKKKIIKKHQINQNKFLMKP